MDVGRLTLVTLVLKDYSKLTKIYFVSMYSIHLIMILQYNFKLGLQSIFIYIASMSIFNKSVLFNFVLRLYFHICDSFVSRMYHCVSTNLRFLYVLQDISVYPI